MVPFDLKAWYTTLLGCTDYKTFGELAESLSVPKYMFWNVVYRDSITLNRFLNRFSLFIESPEFVLRIPYRRPSETRPQSLSHFVYTFRPESYNDSLSTIRQILKDRKVSLEKPSSLIPAKLRTKLLSALNKKSDLKLGCLFELFECLFSDFETGTFHKKRFIPFLCRKDGDWTAESRTYIRKEKTEELQIDTRKLWYRIFADCGDATIHALQHYGVTTTATSMFVNENMTKMVKTSLRYLNALYAYQGKRWGLFISAGDDKIYLHPAREDLLFNFNTWLAPLLRDKSHKEIESVMKLGPRSLERNHTYGHLKFTHLYNLVKGWFPKGRFGYYSYDEETSLYKEYPLFGKGCVFECKTSLIPPKSPRHLRHATVISRHLSGC